MCVGTISLFANPIKLTFNIIYILLRGSVSVYICVYYNRGEYACACSYVSEYGYVCISIYETNVIDQINLDSPHLTVYFASKFENE